MSVVRRILVSAAAVAALGAWLWAAAVRATPEVRARKAAARAARRGDSASETSS